MEMMLAELIEKLFIVSNRIWLLESDIRQGKEKELGLEEVGRRALAIRDLNKQRIAYKNAINESFDKKNALKEIKVNHRSEDFKQLDEGTMLGGLIKLIRTAEIKDLKNVKAMENMLLELGLEDERCDQYYPKRFHKYCGKGLKVSQYPNQFAEYLVYLSDKKISSYMEIGTRWGGSFIITVEYLKRFGKIGNCAICDRIGETEHLREYHKFQKFTYLQMSSGSMRFRNYLKNRKFGLILIDGFHHGGMPEYDFNSTRDKSKYLAIHDIRSIHSLEVVDLWNKLKRNKKYNSVSFVQRYPEMKNEYMGMGILEKK